MKIQLNLELESMLFAISALTQEEEAKTTWRMVIPGDGYKY